MSTENISIFFFKHFNLCDQSPNGYNDGLTQSQVLCTGKFLIHYIYVNTGIYSTFSRNQPFFW